MKQIPYGKHDINQTDIDAVVEILKSDFLTQGPIVPSFENALSSYCGANFAVAVNSATSALHIACLALGVGKGDWVWTSPITFVASANCAIYCGANVDFVDIDPITYNLSIEKITEKLKLAKKENRLPKVVIPVHLCGQSCEMEELFSLSLIYGFKIIEDASHATGAKYKGMPVGNCKYSDITIFSFHPVKIITTCEGGMALTNNQSLANKMALLRSHGITRSPVEMTQPPDGPWFYQQLELGFNYRMNDLQAALGISQLKRLDEFIKRRHQIANYYNKLLADFEVITPKQHSDTYSSFHLYVIKVPKHKKFNRDMIFERLRSSGILVNLHYIPVYRHPFYKKMGFNPDSFIQSEIYYSQAISLPIYPNLSDSEVEEIVSIIRKPMYHQTIF